MLAKLLPVLFLVTGCAHFGQMPETAMVPIENAAPPPAAAASSAPVATVIVPTSENAAPPAAAASSAPVATVIVPTSENAAPPPVAAASSAPVDTVIVPTSPGGPLLLAARPSAPKTPVWKQLAIASGVVGGVGIALVGLGAGLYVEGQNEARAADDYCRAHPAQFCLGSLGFETIPGAAVMSVSAPLIAGGIVLGVLAESRHQRFKRRGN